MKTPYTAVQFTGHFPHGNTMHRETWPMQALASLPDFRVIDMHRMHPSCYQLALEADLLLLGVTMDPEVVPIIRWRRAKGKPTVFEVNDYAFGFNPWNSAFEMWNSPLTQVICLQMMAVVDLVQTSAPFLAKAFEPHCARVAVFPNQIANAPDTLPKKVDQPLVVGFGGSVSHFVDVAQIAFAVSKWVREHDDVVLSVMADAAIVDLFTLPPAKKRTVRCGHMAAYEEFLKGLHIGLAPLLDTPFNRGRSDVKWLEYAANGCVFVGQRVSPYAESVQDGETGLLFDDATELVRILDKLYQDRGLMASVRQSAFAYVTKNRRYQDHVNERARVYKELLDQEPPGGGEEWNLHEQVHFPRIDLPDPLPDYYPVTLDAEEERILRQFRSTMTDVSEDTIKWVERRYGDFHFACYRRALMAFKRRDLASAERHVRRALSFYPAAVLSLHLLGEILIGRGQLKEGREMASLATQWNEAYVPAYRCLVGAMERESDWDAAIAVAEAWEKHCNGDPIACMNRGLLLIRAGRKREGMDTIAEGMKRVERRFKYWQRSFAAELVQILRQADPLMSGEPRWSDLILEVAEMFPYGTWLAVRAGAICFERGEYDRGARILQAARERLLGWEWQSVEGGETPQQYRRRIEAYLAACEERAEE